MPIMNNTENIVLVNGVFTPDEAKEVLLALIGNKIHFHQMRNFSSEERFGKPDPLSVKRLSELYESRKQVVSLLDEAASVGYKLEIESFINIRKGENMNQFVTDDEPSSVIADPSSQDILQLW